MSEKRVAIITGAAGGLGRVLATDLAADHYRLVLVGSDEGRLATLASSLSLPGDRCLTVAADLRQREAAESVITTAYARFGRVDALAHLVGGWTGGQAIAESNDAAMASMVEQHLWTSFNVVRALVPRMVDSGFGRIVAVSSPMAAAPSAGMSAYAVGKAAQETLFAALAREVAGTGVTVNVVRVRAIDTEHKRDADASPRTAAWTTPEEISAAVRYLFSPAAGVVNGERIGLHSGL